MPPQTQPHTRKGSSSESPTQFEPARDEDQRGRRAGPSRTSSTRRGRTLRKSQPTCACQSVAELAAHPRAEAFMWGECGSPSRSAKPVLAVVRGPADHGSLHRHRAEHGEPVADAPERLVGAMGEEPVEADRDPERRQRVAHREDGQVAPGDVAAPEEEDRGEEAGERNRRRAGSRIFCCDSCAARWRVRSRSGE